MLKGITQPAPLGSNAFERGNLDDDIDPHLLGMLEAAGEQPARGLAALVDAIGNDIVQAGVRVPVQVTNQPEFKRVYSRGVTLVGQIRVARRMILVE